MFLKSTQPCISVDLRGCSEDSQDFLAKSDQDVFSVSLFKIGNLRKCMFSLLLFTMTKSL